MAFDKDEVKQVLLSKKFSVLEERANPQFRFWLLAASPTALNHLVIFRLTEKYSRHLIIHLQDHEKLPVVTDQHPFRPGKIARAEFPRMADLDLFLEIVRGGGYVSKTKGVRILSLNK